MKKKISALFLILVCGLGVLNAGNNFSSEIDCPPGSALNGFCSKVEPKYATGSGGTIKAGGNCGERITGDGENPGCGGPVANSDKKE